MKYMDIEKVKKIKYIGCNDDQVRWGSHDDPRGKLKIGKIYKVKKIEIHSSHTKIYLKRFKGSFNSVCFEFMEKKND